MNSITSFLPEIKSLEEAPVEFGGKLEAWHVVAFDDKKKALGGGLHQSKDVARKIAIAEVAERKLFRQLSKSDSADLFLINDFPTTCGFAAGFERDKTRMRAIAEAVERWVWSKWIDENYILDKIDFDQAKLSNIAKLFSGYFDSVLMFKQKINTVNIPDFVDSVEIGIVLGIKGNGVFPGSRVAATEEELWDHAFVEAWRHLDIFRKHDFNLDSTLPFNRIFFFANNAKMAFDQINEAHKKEEFSPEPLLILEHDNKVDGLYLWRAIMKDYVAWHIGDEKRFVY